MNLQHASYQSLVGNNRLQVHSSFLHSTLLLLLLLIITTTTMILVVRTNYYYMYLYIVLPVQHFLDPILCSHHLPTAAMNNSYDIHTSYDINVISCYCWYYFFGAEETSRRQSIGLHSLHSRTPIYKLYTSHHIIPCPDHLSQQ